MSTVLTPRFEEALIYATRLHSTQTRKGSGIPYVSHLMAVAALTLEYGGGEDEAIAALLHDAVEDQGGETTRADILLRFGPAVTGIVDGLTDMDTLHPPWRARKETYIARLHDASDSVKLVSACDKLHNVRSLLMDYRTQGEKLWTRFHGERDGTLWYYRTLVEVLRSDARAGVVGELDRAVTELESLVEKAAPSRSRF